MLRKPSSQPGTQTQGTPPRLTATLMAKRQLTGLLTVMLPGAMPRTTITLRGGITKSTKPGCR